MIVGVLVIELVFSLWFFLELSDGLTTDVPWERQLW